MEFDAEEVTAYLHQHIPVTQAMSIRASSESSDVLRLRARLAPNLNHQETAFGGSIASIGILAGWTLIHLRLQHDEHRYKIVIQKSEMEFLLPIEDDFEAECPYPEESVWVPFHAGLDRKGRARIDLQSSVTVNNRVAAIIRGTFVAKKLESS
ncbi:MAG: thioesterase domain-containing protein [Planctomycetes bacterium]|nr:thioesterase domain-containing protein [Planctomycetota bacterium]MCH9724007.1 thioesterase domain-containing protein [Planctomycetota bacterium]MCH9778063.1 thioesterase domain-containing protein [Planctomycetota bacterium]MCH9791415.1 thioesterase domain-containing protein [Planctomycetota bacterium]